MAIDYNNRQDLQSYLDGIQKYELLSPEQEVEIARRVQKGDIEARDEMVLANLRLVIAIASNYRTRGLLISDLIEEGNLGLLKAVTMFNPELGFRFSTYASWWIKLYIKRAITNSSQTVKIPSYMIEDIYKWIKTRNRLRDETDSNPSEEDIAEAMGVNKKKAGSIVKAMKLMENYNINENADMISQVASPNENSLFSAFDKNIIRRIVDELDERDRFIIIRRYGLDGEGAQTLDEIGKNLKLTRERVRQLEAKVVSKLAQLFKRESSR